MHLVAYLGSPDSLISSPLVGVVITIILQTWLAFLHAKGAGGMLPLLKP